MMGNRGQLRDLLATIGTAETRINDFLRPLNDALTELHGQREQLQDVFEADVHCNCEGCGALILVGDRSHVCRDNECSLCEACAPTWREVRTQWIEILAQADEAEAAEATQAIAAIDRHAAAGGSLDEKMLTLIMDDPAPAAAEPPREGRVVADRPAALDDAANIVRCIARGRELHGDVDTAQALHGAANAILQAKDGPIDWTKFATVIGEPVIQK